MCMAAGPLPTAAEAVPTFSPLFVGRIALESVGSIYWPEFGSKRAEASILKLLLALKAGLHGSRCEPPACIHGMRVP